MTDETKTIEDLTSNAKAALLEAITTAAGNAGGVASTIESLSRAYAAIVPVGPRKGELAE